MDYKMEKDFYDVPLSESNVSLKLADIQKRCSEMLLTSDGVASLSLADETAVEAENNNPYDQS